MNKVLFCTGLLGGCLALPAAAQFPTLAGPFDAGPISDSLRFQIESTERYLREGQLDRASQELQQALSQAPDHPLLLTWAANLYINRRQFALAESYWARLAELFPTNDWVLTRWGAVLLRAHRPDEAEKTLQRVLQIHPQELVARFNMACLHLLRNRPKEAARLLRDLSLYEIGLLATWIRDDEDILRLLLGAPSFATLCDLVTGSAFAAENTGGSDGQTGAEAAAACANEVAGALWSAHVALKSGEWSNAVSALDAALRSGARAPVLRRERALALYRSGRLGEALRELSDLTRSNPNLSGLREGYGRLLLESGDPAGAERELALVWKKRPADTESAFALICAYAAQSKVTDARTIARSLSQEQRAQVAEWLESGHPLAPLLNGNPELLEWLKTGRNPKESGSVPTPTEE